MNSLLPRRPHYNLGIENIAYRFMRLLKKSGYINTCDVAKTSGRQNVLLSFTGTLNFYWNHATPWFLGCLGLSISSKNFDLLVRCLEWKSSKNIIPHGGEKWWFTMVTSVNKTPRSKLNKSSKKTSILPYALFDPPQNVGNLTHSSHSIHVIWYI